MPSPTVSVGPLDEATLRPARFLTLARVGAMLGALVAVVVLAVVLAPRVAAGLGLVQSATATVTDAGDAPQPGSSPEGSPRSSESSPRSSQGSSGSPDGSPAVPGAGETGRSCGSVDVTWGDGQTGTVSWCDHGTNPAPAAGDTVAIWALPGWDPVPAESRGLWTPVAIVLFALLIASGGGAAHFTRDALALRRVGRGAVAGPMLPGRVERIVIGRGLFRRDGRVVIWSRPAGDDGRPLRLVVPGPADRTLLGAQVELCPLRRTVRGRMRGPYVLRRVTQGSGRSGTRVVLGGPVRAGGGLPSRA